MKNKKAIGAIGWIVIALIVVAIGVGAYFIFFTGYSMDDVTIRITDKVFEAKDINEGGNAVAICFEDEKALGGDCTTNEDPSIFSITDKRTTEWNEDYKNAYECLFTSTEPGSYSVHVEAHCVKLE